jgi:hypothetical protein
MESVKRPEIQVQCRSDCNLTEEPEKHAREQRGRRQGEYPGCRDVPDGGQLQAAAIDCHGSGHTRTQNMGGGDRQAEIVGGEDGSHRPQFGTGALRVCQVLFPDLLARGDYDAFPADHRAQSERKCHSHLDPVRDEFGGLVYLALVVCNLDFVK